MAATRALAEIIPQVRRDQPSLPADPLSVCTVGVQAGVTKRSEPPATARGGEKSPRAISHLCFEVTDISGRGIDSMLKL